MRPSGRRFRLTLPRRIGIVLWVLLLGAGATAAQELPVIAVRDFAAPTATRDEARLISDVLRSDIAMHAEVRVIASVGATGPAAASTGPAADYVVTGRVAPVARAERGIVAQLTSVAGRRVVHAAYRVVGPDRPGPALSALADELVLAVIGDRISAGPRRISRLVALDRFEDANRVLDQLEVGRSTAADLRREVDAGLAARLRVRMTEELSRDNTLEARSLLPLYLAYSPSKGPDAFLSEFYTELDARQREQFDGRARDARRAVRSGETVRARRILVQLDRVGRTTAQKKTVSELERDVARAEQTELLRSSRRARWNGRHEEAKLTAEEALARLPEESPRALENVATAEIAADRRDRRVRRREAQPARFTPGTRDRHSLAAGFSVLLLGDPTRRTLVDGAFPSYSLSYENRRPVLAPPLHRSFGGRLEFAAGSDTYTDGRLTLDSRFILMDARARAGISAAFWRHDITVYGEAGLTTLLRRGTARGDTAAVVEDRTAPGAVFAVGIEPTWYFNHRLAVGLRAERALRFGISGARFPSTIVGFTLRLNAGLGEPEAGQPPVPWWATG